MYFYTSNEFIKIQYVRYEQYVQYGLAYVKENICIDVSLYMKLWQFVIFCTEEEWHFQCPF